MSAPATVSLSTTADELLTSLPCPVARASAVCDLARRTGTLSPALAELRRLDLAALRRARTYTVAALAALVGLSAGRISQLTATIGGAS